MKIWCRMDFKDWVKVNHVLGSSEVMYFLFVLFADFVQFLQYYYQSGCLYRLRALGERHTMDLTVGEQFDVWKWIMWEVFTESCPALATSLHALIYITNWYIYNGSLEIRYEFICFAYFHN